MNESKHVRPALFFLIVGVFSGLAIIPYQWEMLGELGKVPELPLRLSAALAIGALQTGLLAFIASWIGLKLAAKTGLGAPVLTAWLYRRGKTSLSAKWVMISISGSAVGSVLLSLLDTFVFVPLIPQLGDLQPAAWWKALLAMFYGGIVEEVLLRLFLMTLVVWLLANLFARNKATIPGSLYWLGLIVSALLFAALHLPATAAFFGQVTPALAARGILFNGLLGIFFGYLYWKKGLEYAMISHMAADVFWHVVIANLFDP
jgi:membrane protease YdiL (CAAX protease family)